MANTKPKSPSADPIADLVTAGGRPVIDLDEALAMSIRNDAAQAEADAAVAETEVRRLELVVQLKAADDEDTEFGEKNLEVARRIRDQRRRRADGLFSRSGLKRRSDLPVDPRLFIANQLAAYQRAQVALEERFANMDLYAVSADEAALPRHPTNPPEPLTETRIRDDAMEGRARIAAYTEWLTAHAEDGPPPADHPENPALQQSVDAFRRFTGDLEPERLAPPEDPTPPPSSSD